MIGKRLNHYDIVESLGAGGMGEVYVAEDTRLDRRVALKVLPAELAGDPQRRVRFEREAKAVAALNHPNIVTIYSVEEARHEDTGLDDETVHFLTMELIEGQPLSRAVPDGGLPLDEFFGLGVQLVDAIEAAHRKGIAHRDLKPANVMVTAEGRVKVLDFGLAKLIEEPDGGVDATDMATRVGAASSDLTEQGRILGTVSYMSPEQAEGRAVDHRSDIFSLGVLLYEMATGSAPFKGDSKISIITSILRDEPVSVSDMRQALPEHLGRIIGRALAKEPKRRFQTAADLRTELENLKVEVDTSEMRHSALGMHDGDAARRAADTGRRVGRPWTIAAAAAVVLALIALAVMWPRWSGTGARSEGVPGAVPASADGRPSLAVLYFDNLSGDDNLEWLRTGLTDMLVTDLSQSPSLRVLGTDRLHQILEDLGKLDESVTSFDVVQAVGQRAGVDKVVVGSFARAGDTIRISARLQDAATGEIVSSERVEGQGEDSIFDLVDDLTRRIKDELEMSTSIADIDAELESVTTDSLEAYRYYAEAMRLHERFQEEAALELLERAVQADPDFAMALAKLSVVHGNLDNVEGARDFARRAMEHADKLSERERYYIEGRYYSLADETTLQAIEAYENGLAMYPDHTAIRHNLASEYMSLGRFDEAIEHLEHLMNEGGAEVFAATPASLANAYAMQDRFADGIRVLRRYVADNPASGAGWTNLGEYLVWAGDIPEAMAALERAERLSPGSPAIRLARWSAHVLEQDWAAAARISEELKSWDNPVARFQGLMGEMIVVLSRGQTAQAARAAAALPDRIPELRSLAANGPTFAGIIHLDRGEFDAAVEQVRRAQQLDPESSNVLGILATALAAAGREEEAARVAAQAIERARAEPQLLAEREIAGVRGVTAFARGDYEEAIGELERALELLPPRTQLGSTDHLRLYYFLGLAYQERGDVDRAIEWFRRAVETREHIFDPVAWTRSFWHLGKLQAERGEIEEARRHYQRFVELWGDADIDRDRVAEARAFLAG